MSRFLAAFLLFVCTLPIYAQGDRAKPNTLTPKEIADGWLLLFDGETTFGWTADYGSKKKGEFKAAAGELFVSGACDITCTSRFPDFEMHFEYKHDKPFAHVALRDEGISGVHFQYVLDKAVDWAPMIVRLRNNKDIQIEEVGSKASTRWTGKPNPLITFDQTDGLKLRNIKLRPLNTTPLFNGKDLTGWNVFDGKKSKFGVVDGAINVKDGPGDLQTVGKYKDFILQLECKSNGEHLNSGIFFRCRENEYQNGYEAQIRNQFTEKPTQKYLIEEYDPKTNKLVGKKELLSTAVDFGTGAIYRRMPARKQMSKDGEWFTMTIVAHGNHFATWVNGVQVADWTDHRPKSDNARIGQKLEAGHISIQGHDPTTDLSFRNIRIAEIK